MNNTKKADFTLVRRKLSHVKGHVTDTLTQHSLQKINKETGEYENTTVEKITAEKTLKAALTLLYINPGLIEGVRNLLPQICQAESDTALLAEITDKNLQAIVKMLFQLKAHANYYTQKIRQFFNGSQFYPRTFVKALQGIFLLDLNSNGLNGNTYAVDEKFIAWCEKIRLEKKLIKSEYYRETIHLSSPKVLARENHKGSSDDNNKDNHDKHDSNSDSHDEQSKNQPNTSLGVTARIDISHFTPGIEFNIKPTIKSESTQSPQCDSNFMYSQGEIAIQPNGNAHDVLALLVKTGAISYVGNEKTWEQLKSICTILQNIDKSSEANPLSLVPQDNLELIDFLSDFETINDDNSKEQLTQRLTNLFVNTLKELSLFINPNIRLIFTGSLFDRNSFNRFPMLELLHFLNKKGCNYNIIPSATKDSDDSRNSLNLTTNALPTGNHSHFGFSEKEKEIFRQSYSNKIKFNHTSLNGEALFITDNLSFETSNLIKQDNPKTVNPIPKVSSKVKKIVVADEKEFFANIVSKVINLTGQLLQENETQTSIPFSIKPDEFTDDAMTTELEEKVRPYLNDLEKLLNDLDNVDWNFLLITIGGINIILKDEEKVNEELENLENLIEVACKNLIPLTSSNSSKSNEEMNHTEMSFFYISKNHNNKDVEAIRVKKASSNPTLTYLSEEEKEKLSKNEDAWSSEGEEEVTSSLLNVVESSKVGRVSAESITTKEKPNEKQIITSFTHWYNRLYDLASSYVNALKALKKSNEFEPFDDSTIDNYINNLENFSQNKNLINMGDTFVTTSTATALINCLKSIHSFGLFAYELNKINPQLAIELDWLSANQGNFENLGQDYLFGRETKVTNNETFNKSDEDLGITPISSPFPNNENAIPLPNIKLYSNSGEEEFITDDNTSSMADLTKNHLSQETSSNTTFPEFSKVVEIVVDLSQQVQDQYNASKIKKANFKEVVDKIEYQELRIRHLSLTRVNEANWQLLSETINNMLELKEILTDEINTQLKNLHDRLHPIKDNSAKGSNVQPLEQSVNQENSGTEIVTNEEDLNKLFSLMFKEKSDNQLSNNINTQLVTQVRNLLPQICKAKAFKDIKIPISDNLQALTYIVATLFELKSSTANQPYPKAFIKIIQGIFLIDLESNKLKDVIANLQSNDFNGTLTPFNQRAINFWLNKEFIPWCKKRGLNPKLIKESDCQFNVTQIDNHYTGIKVKLDMVSTEIEFDVIVNPSLTPLSKHGERGTLFRVDQALLNSHITASNFINCSGEIALTNFSGNTSTILASLMLVGALGPTSNSTAEPWQELNTICNIFSKINQQLIKDSEKNNPFAETYSSNLSNNPSKDKFITFNSGFDQDAFKTMRHFTVKNIMEGLNEEEQNYLKKVFQSKQIISINSLNGLKKVLLKEFTKILDTFEKINPEIHVVFMGGLFNHDSYKNDELTLELLNCLKKKTCSYSILLSQRDRNVFQAMREANHFKNASTYLQTVFSSPSNQEKIKECYFAQLENLHKHPSSNRDYFIGMAGWALTNQDLTKLLAYRVEEDKLVIDTEKLRDLLKILHDLDKLASQPTSKHPYNERIITYATEGSLIPTSDGLEYLSLGNDAATINVEIYHFNSKLKFITGPTELPKYTLSPQIQKWCSLLVERSSYYINILKNLSMAEGISDLEYRKLLSDIRTIESILEPIKGLINAKETTAPIRSVLGTCLGLIEHFQKAENNEELQNLYSEIETIGKELLAQEA